MDLKKNRLIFIYLIIIFLIPFYGSCGFARGFKEDFEDRILKNFEKALNISIYYKKKEGSLFTGFTFRDVSVYKDNFIILKARSISWIPDIKNIRNPLAFLKSFYLRLSYPIVYLNFEGEHSSFKEKEYRAILQKLMDYRIKLEIKNGKILKLFDNPLSVNGTIVWNKVISFSNVKLELGKGNIFLEGSIDPFFEREDLNLSIKARGIPSIFPYYYKGKIDFDIFLRSFHKNLLVKGNATLYKGTLFIKESKGVDNFFINPYLDLMVKAGKDFKVKGGDSYEFEGKGIFNIGSSLKIPKIIGKFVIDSGRILFGNRYFRVIDGHIEFTEFTYLNPVLSIDTRGEVDGIKIFAYISGFARTPKVRLTSIPSFSQDELSSLIMLGKKIEDYNKEDLNKLLVNESLDMAFRSLSLKFMNSMDEMGREYLGLDTFLIEPSFEIYNEDVIKTKLSLKIGKYIGKDFYIKYERVLTPYVNDIFGFELYPAKGLYIDFSIDKKNNIQIELIYEYTF